MTLNDHLRTGATTVCRCWAVTRTDGVVLGFTDHDADLFFDGIQFRADSGLSAKEIEQSSGLSVDNSEAMGVLSHSSISEADIALGLFDAADVRFRIVNWANTDQREVKFRGEIGEIRRSGGQFTAELRGLSEALNKPMGRVYQRGCSAVLGDKDCCFDVTSPEFSRVATVLDAQDNRVFQLSGLGAYSDGWFSKGTAVFQGSTKKHLIKQHTILENGDHEIELWSASDVPVSVGDALNVVAGCDKRMKTCMEKFGNLLNFRGFPDIPGEDWLVSSPMRSAQNDGGSMR